MDKLKKLKISIYADGADFESIKLYNEDELIKGFTTNPSLMKSVGVTDYKNFAEKILSIVKSKPISFEVFSDDLIEIEKQAKEIASWGKNINVKIPVTNTKGESCDLIIKKLNHSGVVCNVTAIFTINQITKLIENFNPSTKIILSIFAGRIADTGEDPVPLMKKAKEICKQNKNIKILWASTREIYNIFEAEKCNSDIITVPYDLIKKLKYVGKDLDQFSLDTIKQFAKDSSVFNLKV
jgi:transaldolase